MTNNYAWWLVRLFSTAGLCASVSISASHWNTGSSCVVMAEIPICYLVSVAFSMQLFNSFFLKRSCGKIDFMLAIWGAIVLTSLSLLVIAGGFTKPGSAYWFQVAAWICAFMVMVVIRKNGLQDSCRITGQE